MKLVALSVFLVGSMAASAVLAAAPSGAPGGSMGMCKDGTYSSSAEKKGACRGHKGVKDWYSDEAPAKPGSLPASSDRAIATPAPSSMTQKTTAADKPSTPAMGSRNAGPATTQAIGGGAGQVWSNDSSKVYHCSGDKWYGKTKHGEYMSESEAKAKGFHPDHGKACS
ncbi:MAG: DUF3761 domain-containing protein [Caldimonas sp.]